jgi:hypothetical protein
MSGNNWPDPARPGVPMNPDRDGWHWLTRKNGLWPEPWRWNPDADGRGAWAHLGAVLRAHFDDIERRKAA